MNSMIADSLKSGKYSVPTYVYHTTRCHITSFITSISLTSFNMSIIIFTRRTEYAIKSTHATQTACLSPVICLCLVYRVPL